jgi:hypothetical protein
MKMVINTVLLMYFRLPENKTTLPPESAVIDNFVKSLFVLTVTNTAGFLLKKLQALLYCFGHLNLCTGLGKKVCYYYYYYFYIFK